MQQFQGPKLLMWKATHFIHVWQREKNKPKQKNPQNLEFFFLVWSVKIFFQNCSSYSRPDPKHMKMSHVVA